MCTSIRHKRRSAALGKPPMHNCFRCNAPWLKTACRYLSLEMTLKEGGHKTCRRDPQDPVALRAFVLRQRLFNVVEGVARKSTRLLQQRLAAARENIFVFIASTPFFLASFSMAASRFLARCPLSERKGMRVPPTSEALAGHRAPCPSPRGQAGVWPWAPGRNTTFQTYWPL